jgi:hypothetical protein
MEIITRQAKGGLLAEMDAFANMTQAEESYAKAGSITWMNPGGTGKIQEKSLPQIPPASIQMFETCVAMLKEVTGINPEIAMGAGGADQPAMTMQQRQMASVALLALEFSALERYKIKEAKTFFDFLPLIADDRIIRVGGAYDSQALQLVRDPFLMEYDVMLDEDTRDPNIRQNYLNMIMQIAPTLVRTGNFLPELINFLPLPAAFKKQLKDGMAQQAQAKAQEEQQGGGKGKESPEETQARIEKIQSDTLYNKAKAEVLAEQMESQLGMQKQAAEDTKSQHEMAIKQQNVQQQGELNKMQLQKNVIEGAQTVAQGQMAKEKHQAELAQKLHSPQKPS